MAPPLRLERGEIYSTEKAGKKEKRSHRKRKRSFLKPFLARK